MADEGEPRYTFEVKYEGHMVPGTGLQVWTWERVWRGSGWIIRVPRTAPRPSLRDRLERWLRLG